MKAQKTIDVADSSQLEALRRHPIDMAHLGNQTLGDEGLKLEVLRLFDDMSKVYFARLESSTAVPDLLRHLHTLRGAAAGVGAFGLAQFAGAMETDLRNGGAVNPERIDDIGFALEETSSFIASLIHDDAN